MQKTLPKAVLSKMTVSELKMFDKLERESDDTLEDMVTKQRKYTQVSRKTPDSKTLPALLHAGFKAEAKAFKAADKFKAYIAKMRTKHA